MIEYVAGFLFLENEDKVALIKKNKPKWQEDKLNGIGGKIETGEFPEDAMAREFEEEAGFKTFPLDWTPFATLKGEGWKVHFFYQFGSQEDFEQLESKTDEEVVVVPIKEVTVFNCIPNLTWLIPLAKSMAYDRADIFLIEEVVA